MSSTVIGTEKPLKEKLPTKLKKERVIVISGPTGVGKSALALRICEVLGGEIVSADSMQVFKGMDIGTAKASLEERTRIPHHLIDIRTIKEGCNVREFYDEAMRSIKTILLAGGVPVVVGGTGFYLHALLYGPPSGPPASPEMRRMLEEEMDRTSSDDMYNRLAAIDPTYAKTIGPKDRQKIVRALEIISLTEKRVSDFIRDLGESESYDFRSWFLYLPREKLYPIIEERARNMVSSGLIEEVEKLKSLGLSENSSASRAIGYRQALEFLESKRSPADLEEFMVSFKQASRRYAKRQFTWFRQESDFRWVNCADFSKENLLELIIQDYEVGI